MKFLPATLFILGVRGDGHGHSHAHDPKCKKFSEIYANPKDLCEKMFDYAFEYTTDEDNAYTMWFFDDVNPNDAVATSLHGSKADTCHLQYFHKGSDGTVDSVPTPEGDDFNECHPWKDSSCCHRDTVKDSETIRKSYGEGYEWDRCGPMSQACR